MPIFKICLKGLILIFLILPLSGCALFQIPGQLIGGALGLAGQAAGVASHYPWWAFL